ncbi:MAG: hypothetical protein PHV18_02575 [Lachnospiraceae bacterium]|nr:hypothetical protein [Lachnospiraceae bacterium]
MMRIKKQVVAAVCCTSLLTAACAGFAQAQSPTVEAGSSNQETTVSGPAAGQTEAVEGQDSQAMQNDQIRIWGSVTNVQDGQITIDNQSGVSYEGEIILNIDPDNSLVLGAENGFAVPLTDIAVGETIYAYIGQTMTMSLPPMTNAGVVIAKVPADFKAPEYVTVQSMTEKDGGSWELTGTNGTTYQVAADCEILPYLTRNIVTLQDVSESRKVLVWSDAGNQAQKLVLFAE